MPNTFFSPLLNSANYFSTVDFTGAEFQIMFIKPSLGFNSIFFFTKKQYYINTRIFFLSIF
jgi:hypothetical protein